MKKIVVVLVLLGFLLPVPVRAQFVPEFDPVEKKLRTPMTLEEKVAEDFKKTSEPAKPGEKPSEGGSNWWKWALGAAVIIGVAAAAGGGGGGGNPQPAGGTGSVSSSW